MQQNIVVVGRDLQCYVACFHTIQQLEARGKYNASVAEKIPLPIPLRPGAPNLGANFSLSLLCLGFSPSCLCARVLCLLNMSFDDGAYHIYLLYTEKRGGKRMRKIV